MDTKPSLDGAEPGDIFRLQDVEVPSGWDAEAWRMLYASEGLNGNPTAVCSILVAPLNSDDLTIYAWGHGTSGTASKCGISLDPAKSVFGADKDAVVMPTLKDILGQGFAVAMTDYENMGTGSDQLSPYLVGKVAGQNVVDVARAAASAPVVDTNGDFFIGGNSQGGHSAVFAGQIANSDYWSDDDPTLKAVVALEPPTQLKELLEEETLTPSQRIKHPFALGLVSFTLPSYVQFYEDTDPKPELSQILTRGAKKDVEAIATGVCATKEGIQDIETALAKYIINPGEFDSPQDTSKFWSVDDPATIPPWDKLLQENSPPNGKKIGVPIFLAQGLSDTAVLPETTEQFYNKICRESIGDIAEFVEYEGITHTALTAAAAKERSAFREAILNDDPPTKCSRVTLPKPTSSDSGSVSTTAPNSSTTVSGN